MNRLCLYTVGLGLLLSVTGLSVLAQPQPDALPGRIEVTCVDGAAHGYATFQSHNQKVVFNRDGIFMTQIRSRDAAYMAQAWRLLRSTDGGKSFQTVDEAVHATNPPVLETDADGVIYLARADFKDGNAYLYRYDPEQNYKTPKISIIPGAAAGKYAMALDASRRQIYFFSHNNRFTVLDLDGHVKTSYNLLQEGPHAWLQYPEVMVAADGVVHVAWTTQKRDVYLYWDIHHLVSQDGGEHWRNLDGGVVAAPVVADDTGPATRITPADEFEAHTFLSSFMVKADKVHFFYEAQTTPAREHYVRYDVVTGMRDGEMAPVFKGQSLQILGLDGFFATRQEEPASPLYCVGSHGGRVVCLASPDNGATWLDYAVSEGTYNVYALGGCRAVTPEGVVLGSFTDQKGGNDAGDQQSKVYFLKISPKSGKETVPRGTS